LEVGILYHTLRELRVVHYSKNVVVLPPGDRYSDMEASRELGRVRKHRIQQQITILEMGKEIMQEE
jgi:hypothetical protein